MNTQYQDSEHDLEAEAKRRALEAIPPSPEGPSSPSHRETEIHNALDTLETGAHRRRLRSRLRRTLRPSSVHPDEELTFKHGSFDEVLAILREESVKRRKRRNLLTGLFVGILGLYLVLAICTHDMHLLATLGSYTSLLTIGTVATQRQKSASLSLARFNDVRAVGPLAEALHYHDRTRTLSPIAENALIELLPRMKASDAALLSPEQRQHLNRALRGKNIDLILAILKAYEQVGDTGAIAEVEKLAAGRGSSGNNPRVVAAAQECLPALRQSAERQQAGAQLLRASDAGPASPDTLLRPALPQASTDPADQLLRPTNTQA